MARHVLVRHLGSVADALGHDAELQAYSFMPAGHGSQASQAHWAQAMGRAPAHMAAVQACARRQRCRRRREEHQGTVGGGAGEALNACPWAEQPAQLLHELAHAGQRQLRPAAAN